MIIYLCDRKFNQLGHASTNLAGKKIVDDDKVQYLENGVVIFTVQIAYQDDTLAELKAATRPGNYLLRKHEKEAEFYQIIDRKRNTKAKTYTLECEDVGMELLNGVAGEFAATASESAAFYINKWIAGTGFEIGLNEISNLRRKLSWDGESTLMERIASIATQFDGAEISYSFETKGLSVIKKLINIHKKRGEDHKKQLRLNYDIDNIEELESVKELATALICTGGTPEGQDKPITLSGHTYDDGDIYVSNGLLISRTATAKWSHDGVTPIIRRYSYETTSKTELRNRGVSELKRIYDVSLSFDIDILKKPAGLSAGDTLYIVDEKGELYVQSRVLELSESVMRQEAKITLGDHILQDSGISAELEALAEKIAKMPTGRTYTWLAYADNSTGTNISTEKGSRTYLGIAINKSSETVDISDPSIFVWSAMEGGASEAISITISSSAGTLFKTGYIATTLTARVLVGGVELSDSAVAGLGVLKWYKDGAVVSTGKTLTIADSLSLSAASYTCRLEETA